MMMVRTSLSCRDGLADYWPQLPVVVVGPEAGNVAHCTAAVETAVVVGVSDAVAIVVVVAAAGIVVAESKKNNMTIYRNLSAILLLTNL